MRLRNNHATRREPPLITLLHRSQGPRGGPSGDTDDDDDGGIPQPGWQDRMPEVTSPRASGDTRVSGVNQEGDSPEAGEDSLAVDTHDDEETVTRAAFSARRLKPATSLPLSRNRCRGIGLRPSQKPVAPLPHILELHQPKFLPCLH
ncbi:hypothetical protein RRG08_060080 [Elysia crispata]|uniref:Uncharacterized protein n=1 Tax=Elysia crispata TaxID=231223 RepID=A0AAE0Y192_9GAST|nr:hypothetical protein RRG08_060080 [Elysia crispata]